MPQNEYIQSSFSGGLNQQFDPTRIGKNEYPLVVNGRSRYDTVQSIRQPKQETTLPMGNLQAIYAAGNYAVAFVDGRAYYKDYSLQNSQFTLINDLQLSATAPFIWAELIPASTINFARVPFAIGVNTGVNLTSLINSSPAALIAQDGENQAWIVDSLAIARRTLDYAKWTVGQREYVPIGRAMLYHGDILYMVSKDGDQIFRSVSGRPLDFMVNIAPVTGDKPATAEIDGGAQTTSHRVAYDPITALAPLNSPDNGFFVSTPRGSFKVVPDYTTPLFGEPQFDNTPLFPTGTLNNVSFVDIIGDSAIIDFTGIRSFNAAKQYRYEGQNSPFSAKVASLLTDPLTKKEILQTTPCAGKFNNYALFSMQTIYGPAVIVYDEMSQAYAGLDIYPGLAAIKQFAEIKTTRFRKTLAITTDNKLYELFEGPTAMTKLYAGEWCSNDPKIQQTGAVFKVVLIDVLSSGTLAVTPFVDGRKQTRITESVKSVIPPNPIPLEIPFGVSSAKKVVTRTFDIGRVEAGWKVGILLEMDFDATISHLSLTAEQEGQVVGPAEEAQAFSRFAV